MVGLPLPPTTGSVMALSFDPTDDFADVADF